jgi:hypothetical protein
MTALYFLEAQLAEEALERTHKSEIDCEFSMASVAKMRAYSEFQWQNRNKPTYLLLADGHKPMLIYSSVGS